MVTGPMNSMEGDRRNPPVGSSPPTFSDSSDTDSPQRKENRWSQGTRAVFLTKAALLLGLLSLHFLSRWEANKKMPQGWRCHYPQFYNVSFSLMSGTGFCLIDLPDIPEAEPLRKFLALERKGVTQGEFEAFVRTGLGKPSAIQETRVQSSRVLDLYLASWIWTWFGISWKPFFLCYCLFSTLVCFLVFQIARQLGGGFWPGFLAALLFLASTLENSFTVYSVRDISPLWFSTIAYFGFVCLADRFRSLVANLLSFLALGFLCTVGYGWRHDARMLPPFFVAALVVTLLARGRGKAYTAAAAVLVLLASWATSTWIDSLLSCPRQDPRTSFLMAYYGDSDRCDLIGLENSFQAFRDDLVTVKDARYYAQCKDLARENRKTRIIRFDEELGNVCQGIYLDAIKYNLFNYLFYFPRFYPRALSATLGHDLPIPSIPFLPCQFIATHRFEGYLGDVLAFLSEGTPYLFPLGLLAVLLFSRDKIRAGSLVVFSIYHCAALFLVLPEFKHAGVLVLPLTVLGGLGGWMLLGLFRPGKWWAGRKLPSRAGIKILAGCLAGCVVLWGLACVFAYGYSRDQRKSYLQDLVDGMKEAVPAPETIKDRRVFAAAHTPGPEQGIVGYLLKIRAGAQPGTLICRHLLGLPSDFSWPGVNFTTRHQLHANRIQFFFVSCQQGGFHGFESRPHLCTVYLDGETEILSSSRMDISNWKKPPLSTVFFDGDCSPGSPRVGSPSTTTIYRVPWSHLNYLGMPFEDSCRYPFLRPKPLAPRFDRDEAGGEGELECLLGQDPWRGFPMPLHHWLQEGKPLKEMAGGGRLLKLKNRSEEGYFSSLRVPEDGVYLVQVKGQLLSGRVILQALNENFTKELNRDAIPVSEGEDQVFLAKMALKAGDRFRLRIVTDPHDRDDPAAFIIKEITGYKDEKKLVEFPGPPGN